MDALAKVLRNLHIGMQAAELYNAPSVKATDLFFVCAFVLMWAHTQFGLTKPNDVLRSFGM